MAINITSPLKKIRRKFRSARTADQNARLAGTFQQGKPDMAVMPTSMFLDALPKGLQNPIARSIQANAALLRTGSRLVTFSEALANDIIVVGKL